MAGLSPVLSIKAALRCRARPLPPPLIEKSAGCVFFSNGRERETRRAYLALTLRRRRRDRPARSGPRVPDDESQTPVEPQRRRRLKASRPRGLYLGAPQRRGYGPQRAVALQCQV